ncbi:Uncharacterised protein [Mycobacteroides abscessus subsp. massiliense]|nr:Uncharacterised protein [Mycobacteroides abscessus subsp. abscessus]SKQ87489.1 Uncharacterised protein [Mycobacteroides abscessus subsp. massiliense]SLC51884.1 Uncharacterised protein [Mycobacteroides abscessus subsp. massiliense]
MYNFENDAQWHRLHMQDALAEMARLSNNDHDPERQACR